MSEKKTCKRKSVVSDYTLAQKEEMKRARIEKQKEQREKEEKEKRRLIENRDVLRKNTWVVPIEKRMFQIKFTISESEYAKQEDTWFHNCDLAANEILKEMFGEIKSSSKSWCVFAREWESDDVDTHWLVEFMIVDESLRNVVQNFEIHPKYNATLHCFDVDNGEQLW